MEERKLTNAELIKALRWCGSEDERHEMCVDESYSCPLWNEDRMTDYCKADLMLAAADALEAQQVDLRKANEIIAEGIKVSRKSRAALEIAQKRIAELEAQLPEWISVYDLLPERSKDVIVANSRGKQWDIDKAWFNGEYFDRCGKRPLFHVTHWMPLPNAPKGE